MDFIYNIPRQVIYALVAAAVFTPILLKMEADVIPAPESKAVYEYVDKLTEGSVVLFAQDYDPSSEPELTPMTMAFLRHCFKKKLKVISVNVFSVAGVGLGQLAFKQMEEEFGVKSGTDYVYLGFRPGLANSIRAVNAGIVNYFVTDANLVETSSMPIFEKVKSGKDIDFLLTVAAGATPEAWRLFGASESGYPMAAGCTAVSFASYFPFYQSGQFTGILGGLKGAADYEQMVGVPGIARKGMVSQSFVHILLIVLIVLGNFAFVHERAARRSGGAI